MRLNDIYTYRIDRYNARIEKLQQSIKATTLPAARDVLTHFFLLKTRELGRDMEMKEMPGDIQG